MQTFIMRMNLPDRKGRALEIAAALPEVTVCTVNTKSVFYAQRKYQFLAENKEEKMLYDITTTKSWPSRASETPLKTYASTRLCIS